LPTIEELSRLGFDERDKKKKDTDTIIKQGLNKDGGLVGLYNVRGGDNLAFSNTRKGGLPRTDSKTTEIEKAAKASQKERETNGEPSSKVSSAVAVVPISQKQLRRERGRAPALPKGATDDTN
jgi:hypothetical protein